MSSPTPIGAARGGEAGRAMEWTGERMLPWVEDAAVAYEHLHRYLFALRYAHGKRVLDLGSGEGYGAALLASVARTVTGVDIDAEAVEHARSTYGAEALRYEQASADDLSGFDDDAFDVVTCFEVIEHVEAQDRVLAETRRVLAPDGILLCSTPEREAYRVKTGRINPFHVRELDRAEFERLLSAQFEQLALWSQVTVSGSLLEPLAAAGDLEAETFHVGLEDGYWDVRERSAPLYLVAAASAVPLPAGRLSVSVDPRLRLVEQERIRAERAERLLQEARAERAEAEERIRGYRAGMELREQEVKEVVAEADALREEMLAAGDAAAEREAALAAEVRELSGRLARLASIERSLAYRSAKAARNQARRLGARARGGSARDG